MTKGRPVEMLERQAPAAGAAQASPTAAEAAAGDARELVRLQGIGKRFAGVTALDGVDFDLQAGEVHAVCGENGAGKSTLMKIVSGQLVPCSGRILVRGRPVQFGSTRDAERQGIAMIHQELNLVPHLSVAENICLAREPRRWGLIDRAALRRMALEQLQRLQVDLDPDALVSRLSVAQQQMVEIAKALSLKADVLIMDEPTSSLTESETDQLFKVMHELKASGVGVIYISHRLDELQKVVDRVTVLRDGRHVSTTPLRHTSVDTIVEHMVGRSLKDKFPPARRSASGTVLLRARGLSRRDVFDDVSFELRRGEILGFAGLMGAGRTEVARAVFGADPLDAGQVWLGDRALAIRSPRDAIAHGIAYLSENRKADGLAIEMGVAENITMANMRAVSGPLGFIGFRREQSVAQRYIELLGIRTPSARQRARLLSGGNQQKVVISKWLFRGSKVLFFDEPTRGIDVGAKFAIYQLLDELAADGIGVVVISSELPEILGITDRVVVFHQGRVAAVLDTARTNQEEIMQFASGFGRPLH
jgi:ribose transport system ATP-binding protein